MLDMEEEYGFAYWVSGVLFWLMRPVMADSNRYDLMRFFRVHRKIREVGYAIHEDIPTQFNLVDGQVDGTYNAQYEVFTDLRHARYVDDDLTDWTKKEVKICKKAASNFLSDQAYGDLTKWCRAAAQKRLGLRERQLLVAHFVDGG